MHTSVLPALHSQSPASHFAAAEWIDRSGASEVSAHRDYLFKFAMKKVSDEGLADDLVQETLLVALQSRDGNAEFGGRSSYRGWLVGILKHKIMDAYRDRYRFVSLTLENDDGEQSEDHPFLRGHDSAAQSASDPLRSAELSQLLDHVKAAVAQLPSGVAEVFMAREIEGESTASITKRLGVTEENIWVRVHRARKALQGRLLAVGAVETTRAGRLSAAH